MYIHVYVVFVYIFVYLYRMYQVLAQMRDNDKLINEYETLVTNLLSWIQKMTEELSDRSFPNTISGVQALVTDFNQFRTVEKPPK